MLKIFRTTSERISVIIPTNLVRIATL